MLLYRVGKYFGPKCPAPIVPRFSGGKVVAPATKGGASGMVQEADDTIRFPSQSLVSLEGNHRDTVSQLKGKCLYVQARRKPWQTCTSSAGRAQQRVYEVKYRSDTPLPACPPFGGLLNLSVSFRFLPSYTPSPLRGPLPLKGTQDFSLHILFARRGGRFPGIKKLPSRGKGVFLSLHGLHYLMSYMPLTPSLRLM